jgi:hypothetical protein
MMFGYSRGTSSDDSNPSDHAVQLKESLSVHMALSSSITCILPLFLDFLFDYFYYNEIFRINNNQYKASYDRNTILILLLSYLICIYYLLEFHLNFLILIVVCVMQEIFY